MVLVERVMESEVESRFLCQAESGSSQKSRRDIHIRAGKKQSKLLSLETGILGEELTSSNLNSMTLSSVSFYDLTWSEMSSPFTALFLLKNILKISNSQQANKLLENNLFIK